jgi:EAL domain-containing protein (putative c-di-GMP-specific phosphodiesterase class I)
MNDKKRSNGAQFIEFSQENNSKLKQLKKLNLFENRLIKQLAVAHLFLIFAFLAWVGFINDAYPIKNHWLILSGFGLFLVFTLIFFEWFFLFRPLKIKRLNLENSVGIKSKVDQKWINNFQDALKKQKLKVYFQPQYDVSNHRLVGAEALIRWENEAGEILLPENFLPAVEKNGLMSLVGDQVLAGACRLIQSLPKKPLFSVTVKLSQSQWSDKKLLKQLREAIEASLIDPGSLVLEMKESTLMANGAVILVDLFALDQLGVRLALSDMTEISKIEELMKAYPFKMVKLDRAWIQNVEKMENAQNLIHDFLLCCDKLLVQPVITGVETFSQLDFINENTESLGLNKGLLVQGFFLGKPMPKNAFLEVLSKECSAKSKGLVRPFLKQKQE